MPKKAFPGNRLENKSVEDIKKRAANLSIASRFTKTKAQLIKAIRAKTI